MKTITFIIATMFCNYSGMAQVTQDSINKLQADINKRQRDINAMQRTLNKNNKATVSSEDLIRSILNDLLDMKIISNKDEVTFSLSSDQIEVNHKRQPESVLETFASKYHIIKGYSIAHAQTKNSSSTSITK